MLSGLFSIVMREAMRFTWQLPRSSKASSQAKCRSVKVLPSAAPAQSPAKRGACVPAGTVRGCSGLPEERARLRATQLRDWPSFLPLVPLKGRNSPCIKLQPPLKRCFSCCAVSLLRCCCCCWTPQSFLVAQLLCCWVGVVFALLQRLKHPSAGARLGWECASVLPQINSDIF